jgi:hypothetical protein
MAIVPLLMFLSMAAWAFATPAGSSPDETYHLNSIWCGQGLRPGICEAGSTPQERKLPIGLWYTKCTAGQPTLSATECQLLSTRMKATNRLNTDEGYPKLYYAVMSIFASKNLLHSIVTIRLVNVALFAFLTSVLYFLLPPPRRMTLVLGWTAALVPLGLFLIASVNPSGWVVTGCGTAWLATIGYFEQRGWRKIGLAVVAVAAVFMAAGTRGDGAVYVGLSVIAATLLAARKTRNFWMSLLIPLPLIAAVISFVFAKDARQLLSVINGELGWNGVSQDTSAVNVGFGLLFQNILNLPALWLGAFGVGTLGNLGWFDVPMPWAVPAGALLAYLGVLLWGIRDMTVRKGIVMLGTLTLISVVTLWFLQLSHFTVGTYLQPRYLYPGVVLLVGVAALAVGRRRLEMSIAQLTLLGVAVTIANGAALYYAMRRYVDPTPNAVFFDLGTHRRWWWDYSWIPTPQHFWYFAMIAFALTVGLSLFLSVPRRMKAMAAPVESVDAPTAPVGSDLDSPLDEAATTPVDSTDDRRGHGFENQSSAPVQEALSEEAQAEVHWQRS